MKKSVVLLIFILSSSAIFGQLKFGAKGGINNNNVRYSAPSGLKEPSIESKYGFYLGGTVEYQITENLALLSGLNFTVRGFKAKSEEYTVGRNTVAGYSADYSANYLDIPLNLKYNYTLFGYQFYGTGGFLAGFKVSESSNTATETKSTGVPVIIITTVSSNSLEGVKSTSAEQTSTEDYFGSTLYSLSLGIGMEIPISSFFIAPEINYNFGLNKVNKPEGFGDTKLRDFMIGLAFKF